MEKKRAAAEKAHAEQVRHQLLLEARDKQMEFNENLEVADMGITFDYEGHVLSIEKTKLSNNNGLK